MNKYLKIGIVVLILLVIGGIYVAKNGLPNSNQVADADDSIALTPVDQNTSSEAEVAETVEAQEEDPLTLEWTSFNFDSYLERQQPMILYFGAADCQPCQVMKPDFLAFHEEHKEEATIHFFDVWKKPELVGNYPISAIPTMVFFLPDGTPYEPDESLIEEGILFQRYLDKDTEEHALTTHTGILTKDQLDRILEDMEKSS